MDYTDEECSIIEKRKDILQIRYEKKNKIEKQIKELKNINPYYLNGKEYQEYNTKLTTSLNQLRGIKSAITKHKKKISKIVSKYLYDIDNNLLVLIIEFLQDIKFINMITATKQIYNLYIQEGNYNIIYICCKKYCRTHKIPKELLYGYDINLEQLFYIPITKEGRTLIHIIVRKNQLNIMKYLLQKYNKLNINVGTTVGNWRPIHNAINLTLYNMVKLLITNYVNYNVELSTKPLGKINNIIDFSDIYKSTYHDSYIYERIYNYIVDNSGYMFDKVNIQKNIINYKDIENNKYIMNVLNEISDDLIFMYSENMHMNII